MREKKTADNRKYLKQCPCYYNNYNYLLKWINMCISSPFVTEGFVC